MIFPAPVLVQESVAVQEIASGHVMEDLNYPAQGMLQWYRTDYLSCTSRGKYAVYRKFYPILHQDMSWEFSTFLIEQVSSI